MVIVCFLEKNNLPLSPYSGYKLAYKPIQGQKKVGIKQAAERENEFHKTLTFNLLQNGKQGDFDHIKRLLETYLFLKG